jgi:hypothetical protein
MPLRTVSLDDLVIDDEPSLARIEIYPKLKAILRRSGHRFHLPAAGGNTTWDRVLFLNLTYWSGAEAADVLVDEHLAADVLTHIAWHHLVGTQLGAEANGRSAAAMLFGESIASAFDLYVLGRLWREAPDSEFVTTQVPIISEAAQDAGMSDDDFAELISDVAEHPERAFEDLRQLLFDATTALASCAGALEAQATLERLDGHRLAPLLHHYQLSNWILYARAYATPAPALDEVVRKLDTTLRQAPSSLGWLTERWLAV